jgi:hypothetical protein
MYILFIPILVLCAALSAGAQVQTNWANRIVSKEVRPLRYWFSPCGETITRLAIDGRRFDHVRGVSKFYLQVPGTNAIVFIVDEKDYSITIHIFMMDTDEDIAIPAAGSDFGQTIGSTHPRESVELASDGKVIISTFDKDVKSVNAESKVDAIRSLFYLDLKKKLVVAERTEYYSSGKLISEGHWP